MNLREENDYLREQVARLEAVFADTSDVPLEWGLTTTERSLVSVLKKRSPSPVSKDGILIAMYGLRQEEPDPKIVDVLVCKARKKMVGTGWHIRTFWGIGYALIEGEDEVDRGRIRAPNWTPEEDRQLRLAGSPREAAEIVGRTTMACWARAQKIGHRWGRRRRAA